MRAMEEDEDDEVRDTIIPDDEDDLIAAGGVKDESDERTIGDIWGIKVRPRDCGRPVRTLTHLLPDLSRPQCYKVCLKGIPSPLLFGTFSYYYLFKSFFPLNLSDVSSRIIY